MFFGRAIFGIICKGLKNLFRVIELHKYNRFTIAEYLRKQGARIGEGCSIIPTSLGDEAYLIKIGNNVTIAHGVVFMTHDGGAWVFRREVPDLQVFGPIIVEDNCVIGLNVIILPNVRIGKNSIVGAGSVVISDIPPNSIALGVPARVFGSVDKYKEKCFEHWKEQRPSGYIIEEGANAWTTKHIRENRDKLKKHLINLFKDRMV